MDTEVPREPRAALLLQDVHFAYPRAQRAALELPHLQVEQGQRLMLRGPSGCGKSTLLSLSAGVLMPQQGRVELLGVDWASLSPAARDARRVDHVGYIFQQFNLLPYLSAIDNVLLPCRFSRQRRRRAAARHGSAAAAAATLLQALELPQTLHQRPPLELSVGQQQRVAAARALIGQPEIVIADEPTSALDEELRESFMQLLLSECARTGCALLFVTHDRRLSPHFDQVLDLPALNRAGGS